MQIPIRVNCDVSFGPIVRQRGIHLAMGGNRDHRRYARYANS
jgi:hypothetical protein